MTNTILAQTETTLKINLMLVDSFTLKSYLKHSYIIFDVKEDYWAEVATFIFRTEAHKNKAIEIINGMV